MAKTLTFEYDGKDWTLEFTRASVVKMEQDGFKVSDMETYPLSTLPEFFAGAFLAHHPSVSRKRIDAIYEAIADKEGLMACLAEMYVEPIEALMGEPDEEGKVVWAKNW